MSKKNKKQSVKIAIIVSRFNEEVTGGLLNGAVEALKENEINDKSINIFSCPGAFEIPQTAKALMKKKKFDAIICLGAVIKGDTAHFEFISGAVTNGIMKLNLESDTPVLYGVLTCFNDEQALKRSAANSENKGREAAMAALDMIKLINEI